MEWPKWETYRIFVDPALQILEQLHDELPQNLPHFNNPIPTVLLDLKFFKMFLWGLAYWEESQHDWRLLSVMSNVGCKLRQASKEFTAQCQCEDDGDCITKDWDLRCYHLETSIQQYKPQVKEICILLLNGAFKSKPCPHEELLLEYARQTATFTDFILQNLVSLNLKIDLIAPLQQKIVLIQEKLKLFLHDACIITFRNTSRAKSWGDLLSHTRTWANLIACLACLYWTDGMDESLTSTMGTMLSDLIHKNIPYTLGVITSHLEVTLIPHLLPSYIDFLLEELVLSPMRDDIESLREGLTFFLSFIRDPPKKASEDREHILGQIYSITNELPSLICSILYNEMEERIFETKLSAFLQKIAGVEAEVRRLYAITPHSSQFNSPRTNAIGFLDSLLQKLKKWLEGEVNFTARVKQGIQTVLEELARLKPFMHNIRELQNEQEELKYLWNRIANLVYCAAYVTNICSAPSFSIWYGIISLPSVIEEIKLIKNEVKDIKDSHMCKKKMLSVEMEFRNNLLPQATTSKVEGAFVGFEDDVRRIIDHLVRGSQHRTIISISGMPGQGKTTLAKKIYNDPQIQYHFHKTVWCCVSEECKIRDLTFDILQDVRKADGEDISKLGIQDLAEKLRKTLKGYRYLIVMDDIWDVEVWRQVRGPFPDDRNGSRILFTSRNHNLKSHDEVNFISYPLRSFSEEESWELMEKKLSHCNGLGLEFLEIGKQIAIYCKGLPLAVALAASVLGNTEQKLDLWKQVAENLKSYLASEGCMHVIELSYKYLPEHLKSCFLYFGAFPRGENIRAKKLQLLWIAEGFIKGNEMQIRHSEDLAEEYLDYLVSQSLVVVTEISSMGRIKTCNVHDLVYDLCSEKIVEENFSHWVDEDTVSDESRISPQKYAHHRLCIGASDPLMKAMPLCRRNELPTSQTHSLLWFDDSFDYSEELVFRFLKSFRVLTVLDLEEVMLGCREFPEVILCNIHLKYLSLYGSTIKRVPPSIADLWSLETLVLRVEVCDILPDTMWRMKSLRHVKIWRCVLSLEEFEGNESYVAAQNLETLCGPYLGDDASTVEFLRRFARLRKLKCFCKEQASSWFSVFGSLQNLEELTIRGASLLSASHLESNFPQMNLKKLTLDGFFGLRLSSWSAMSTIGKQLPNLEVLKLRWNACEGSIWDLEDGKFSKLRYLKLRYLNYLRQINVCSCDNPFPCLEKFIVRNCERLDEIPPSFGEICTLNSIKMHGVSSKASKSAMKILQQQRDMGNHSLQVFVKNILDKKKKMMEDEEDDDENEDYNDDDDDDEEEEEDYDDNYGDDEEKEEDYDDGGYEL